MADIRINSLPTTATSFNANDYIAIDGASGGTRKMLAANLPLTDVTFGSGGPSAKSSIDARAARQGLVFDGTGSVSSFSGITPSGDFSASVLINVTSYGSSGRVFLSGSGSPSFEFGVLTTGAPYVYNGTTVLSGTAGSLVTGKFVHLVYTRSGTSGTFYINGVASGTVSDSTVYGPANQIGGNNAISGMLGTIAFPLIYNRALSAAEVVSLFEAGVPAGADYNTASNTALNTNTVTTAGSGSIAGTSATGFAATATGAYYVRTAPVFSVINGAKYRVTFTASGLTGSWGAYISLFNTAFDSAVYPITSGVNTFEMVATATRTTNEVIEFSSLGVAGTLTVSGLSVTRVGLLLAPDAGQAGGGLTWYDTSGNSANITLPASGVSWNVPTSAKTASGWTFGGNLTVSGTSGVNQFAKTVQIVGFNNPPSGTGLELGHDGTQGLIQSIARGTGATDLWLGGNTVYIKTGGSAATTAATFSNTTTTLAGNLTVSGTGTSSFAGNLLVTNSKFSFWDTGDQATNGYLEAGHFSNGSFIGTVAGTNAIADLIRFGTSGTERMRLNSSGNLLIAATVDSGNGKLQLATHTTSAGGIGFGTATSLYTQAAGNLALDHIGGTNPVLNFRENGTAKAYVGTSGSILYVGTNTAQNVVLQTNAITALVLDSSQNATFASAAILSSASAGFYMGDINTDGTWRFIRGGNNLYIQRRELGVYQTKQTYTP